MIDKETRIDRLARLYDQAVFEDRPDRVTQRLGELIEMEQSKPIMVSDSCSSQETLDRILSTKSPHWIRRRDIVLSVVVVLILAVIAFLWIRFVRCVA